MGELDAGDGALALQEARDPCQRLDVPVVPDAEVAKVIRPSRVTAVASAITSPALPMARLPR
jgi:hypothetical protein